MNSQACPLIALLDNAVKQYPDRIALRIGPDEHTYTALAQLVNRCAVHLSGCGVTKSSRIGLSAGNSPEFVAVVFAAARLGATIVMVSTAWRDREVEHALTLTEPTHLVHDGSGAARLDLLVTDRPVIHIDDIQHSAATTTTTTVATVATAVVELDDLAVMVFSSGTTGLPKAVRHTHRTMHAATEHWVATLGMTSEDRLQIATPPFHILGLLNLLAVAAAGASVRLHHRFDLDVLLNAIQEDRITIEMAVAPIALAMAAHPNLESFDLSSLRYIMWGATPVTASIAETVTRRTGVRFLPAYGASELPVIAVNPVHRPAEWRLDSVGLPPRGVQLRVVNIETGAVLSAGESGELQARSPSLMVGYLPESATKDSVVDGWYRTGDVGAVDENGWVTITDRVKEMIKVNGFQVAPAEVEAVLLSHTGVIDCAVFGVPHERTGEAVVAAVVIAVGVEVTGEELRDLVADNLAAYKRVHEILFMDQIPRLPSGKVLRRELQSTHGN